MIITAKKLQPFIGSAMFWPNKIKPRRYQMIYYCKLPKPLTAALHQARHETTIRKRKLMYVKRHQERAVPGDGIRFQDREGFAPSSLIC